MISLKMLRFFRVEPLLKLVLSRARINHHKINLSITFYRLLLILHIIGNFWATASSFDLESNNNWLNSSDIKDASPTQQYLAAVYWAVVTCTTVGYGDILPTNFYEKMLALTIIVLGVAIFTIILSSLATQFITIRQSMSKKEVGLSMLFKILESKKADQ